jgi:RimJ/RimL family protein N-acetyltransferase
MSDVIFRALREGELSRFQDYAHPPRSGVGARSRTYEQFVADGDYRAGWVWVAERDGAVVARAAFAAPPGEALPWSLDWFDTAPGPGGVAAGANLLRAAYAALVPSDYATPPHPDGGRPDYHLFLPADWRDRAETRRDAEDRIAAAERAGLRFFVERINLRRTADAGLPPRSGRLRFTPASDDPEALSEALTAICSDTQDAYARRDADRHGPGEAARIILDEVAEMPGPGRDWWRLARRPETDDVIGVVLPTRNPYAATIGYLGVVPRHRGKRYADDLVAEALHLFSEAAEPLVDDATDVSNAPMVAAFVRNGYHVVGHRVILV